MSDDRTELDPTETVRAIFAALDEKRWADAAAFTDPDFARELKDAVLEAARDEEERRARRIAEASAPGRVPYTPGPYWYRPRYGVASMDELTRLDPLELVGRVAAAEGPDRAYAQPPRPDAPRAEPLTLLRHVIGHVLEGEDVAHVVYRRTWHRASGEFSSIDTLATKRSDGRWRAAEAGHLNNFLHPYPTGE